MIYKLLIVINYFICIDFKILLAFYDVTAEEFELLCGKKLGRENDDAVTDDVRDSEWEEAEL